ncbi:MAG: SDR family NAD(P)-dependent oxidoreductase [Anaerolineales bacterium]|nr:SDR family NAD(P)-dependent oxidoreductase [Anaerolineales bacterium]
MSKSTYPLPSRGTPLAPRRKAILVGASSGIGAALAHKLTRQGYTVALLARRADLLQALADEINHQHNEQRARIYVHDVLDHQAVPTLLNRILTDLGGLDLVIYNAGVNLPPEKGSTNVETDCQMAAVNYQGALAWLNPVATLFESLGAGQIVGISSVAGDRGRAGNPGYTSSKAALSCYLEALRNRLSSAGVHVLTVKPGFVDTEMLKAAKRAFWVIPPEKAAGDIYKAIQRRKQTIYTSARWGLVMLILRHIPSFVFRRLKFLA